MNTRILGLCVAMSFLSSALIYVYFKNKVTKVDEKLDVLYQLIQSHASETEMYRNQQQDIQFYPKQEVSNLITVSDGEASDSGSDSDDSDSDDDSDTESNELVIGDSISNETQIKKISPGFNSPIVSGNYNDLSPDEKKEIVMNSPSFGMFSLFKYHIKRGYRNEQLKKENKIYLSHIFSLICALPIMIFIGQWMLFVALVFHEAENYGGEICPRTGTFANKLMISGISIIYFARSFFIWDKLTNSLSLKKMNRVNSYTSVLDTFQEFSFILLIYGANIWVVYYEDSIQDMILNSLAMEFLMMLDNEFEELYFQYLPGAAEDIYDNVFVSYYENIELLEDRKRDDKCFRCFSCAAFIPYKLLVLSMFLFPLFCLFMTIVGPICK